MQFMLLDVMLPKPTTQTEKPKTQIFPQQTQIQPFKTDLCNLIAFNSMVSLIVIMLL